MATSTRYDAFNNRIKQLKDHLLPAINPIGTYTDQDQDMIRSYCLLCHAETEAYLEDFTLEIVKKAFTKWSADKTKISPIIFHLIFSYSSKNKEAPYSMINLAYISFVKVIESNNGIKENNLINFFKPIGFPFDSTLQITLNNFGSNRGQIAHKSFTTQNPLDPATELANVTLILRGLKSFDEDLSTYESAGIPIAAPKNMQWERFSFFDRIKILFLGKV